MKIGQRADRRGGRVPLTVVGFEAALLDRGHDGIAEAYRYHLDGTVEAMLSRDVPYPGRCIMHKPQLGDTLPVYVWDKYDEYPNVGVGMWWALQTITTVGYGDVTPSDFEGRLVAAVVMLQGVAFIAIITAVITSTFIERAHRERMAAETLPASDLAEAMASINARLVRIEQQLDER